MVYVSVCIFSDVIIIRSDILCIFAIYLFLKRIIVCIIGNASYYIGKS